MIFINATTIPLKSSPRNDFYKRNNISLKIFPRQPWVIECDMVNYHKLIGKFLRCHRCHPAFIYLLSG